MKKVLPLVLYGLMACPAGAQTEIAPDIEIQQMREAAKGSKKVVLGTGFYWLLKAAEALDSRQETIPWYMNMTSTQQLAYDRAFIAQQKEALQYRKRSRRPLA